ncbi:hypothetical protein ROZALSC1DRAFT_29046 [Rozella allomycis CSF55]|uniref:CBS domain-containing protein n=1 Tax=Rozella allomycis (strain CSF55) TaxID=988480 RepID=A0A075B3Q3_ROZAC|nr:hypothetical protein O9G_003951 [Rozella allomycis CSF55]RKP19345.1 hypothetical protein ROZALSC1DRAFT_29046 [Rozella allomycis CSF55]|eukprot:EPZ35518.1 hypothetical protein O9G_003951 [Rozella allomycis CSF55]
MPGSLSPTIFLIGEKIKSASCPVPLKIVTTKINDNAKDALNKLIDQGIHSMPVTDLQDKFLGIVSMTDFVQFLKMVEVHDATMGTPNVYRFAKEWVELNDASVESVMKKSKRKPEILEDTKNLRDAAEKLSNPGIYRVVVLTQDHKVSKLITQSQIIELVFKRLNELQEDFLNKKVKTITNYENKEMYKQVSAVPIVDDNNNLVGTISERDIRVLASDKDFPACLYNNSSLEFAKKIKSQRSDMKNQTAITCRPDSTIREIHRVWVTDSNGKLVNVVSLKDIITEIVAI